MYHAIYNTEKSVFYFNINEDSQAIVRVFPLKDYRKIDPKKMKEYDLGVLYINKDNRTLLEDEEAVFNFIPEKADGIIYKEEIVSGKNFVKVKPAILKEFEESTTKEKIISEE